MTLWMSFLFWLMNSVYFTQKHELGSAYPKETFIYDNVMQNNGRDSACKLYFKKRFSCYIYAYGIFQPCHQCLYKIPKKYYYCAVPIFVSRIGRTWIWIIMNYDVGIQIYKKVIIQSLLNNYNCMAGLLFPL